MKAGLVIRSCAFKHRDRLSKPLIQSSFLVSVNVTASSRGDNSVSCQRQLDHLAASPRQGCGSRRAWAWETGPAAQLPHAGGSDHTSGRMWCGGCPAWPTSGVPTDGDPSTSLMISSFSEAGYLIRGRPHRLYMLFLRRRSSSVCSATTSFRSRASRRRSLTSSVFAARAVSPSQAASSQPP